MAIVAPGVFRVTMNGTYDSQPVAHVIDFVWEGVSGTQPNRIDMGPLVCAQLGAAWVGTLDLSQSNLVTYSGCTWVDLDSSEGPTGTFNAAPFPFTCQNTSQPMPGNVAPRIIKTSSGPRGSRRGSIYLPGGTDALTPASSANTMSGVAFTDLQTRVAAFYTDLINTFSPGGGATARIRPVIVRTRSSEYRTTSAVTGFSVQPRLGSQRRRLDLT